MKKLKLLRLVALTVVASNIIMPITTQAAEFPIAARMIQVDTEEARISRLLPKEKLIEEKEITPENVVVDMWYDSNNISIKDDGIYVNNRVDFKNPTMENIQGFRGYLSSKDGKVYKSFRELPDDTRVQEGRPAVSFVFASSSPLVRGVKSVNRAYWRLLGTATVAPASEGAVARRASISQAITSGLTVSEAYTLARTVGYSHTVGGSIKIPGTDITGSYSYGMTESIQESFQKTVATNNQETTTITQFYDPNEDGKEHLVGLYQRVEEFETTGGDQSVLDSFVAYEMGGGFRLSVNRKSVVKLNVTDSADVVLE